MELVLNPEFEYAALVLAGQLAFEDRPLQERTLYYLGAHRSYVSLRSPAGGRLLLIGGPPFPEKILMWWNFVARTPEEIAEARADWEGGRPFGEVIGEHSPLDSASRAPWSAFGNLLTYFRLASPYAAPMFLEHSAGDAAATLEDVYRTESRRVLATLIHLLGDFDLAEDALQEAFAAAAVQWPRDGVPSNPRAWLVSTGRFKAIDALRRRSRSDVSLDTLLDQFDGLAPGAGGAELSARSFAAPESDPAAWDYEEVGDDRLRLIFTCCHPVLPPDARVALTLREVCDLTTEEIARAFLVPAATLAQRIVRAKAKLREAGVPFEAPPPEELPERLDAVLQVIYLVFNEGYSASAGPSLTRPDLSGEAIRLGRLLLDLLLPTAPKGEPEVVGLLALMLLQESRRTSRTSPEGDLIPLEEQDRSLWDRNLIAEGIALAARALSSGRLGYYSLQAAIAAEHARAPGVPETDWSRIARLYKLLAGIAPSPVIELNRAVAVAMADGPEAGLALVDALLARGELSGYHLAYAVRADLCRRLGRAAEARVSYGQALALAKQESERRYLQRRLAELPAG